MPGGIDDLKYLASRKDREAMGLVKKKTPKAKPDPRRGSINYALSGKSVTDGKGSVVDGMWSPNAPAKKKTPTAKKSYNGHQGK